MRRFVQSGKKKEGSASRLNQLKLLASALDLDSQDSGSGRSPTLGRIARCGSVLLEVRSYELGDPRRKDHISGRQLLTSVVWQLIACCDSANLRGTSAEQAIEVERLAAKCLGQLGPVASSAITFDDAHVARPPSGSDRLATDAHAARIDHWANTLADRPALFGEVCVMLVSYMLDADAETAAAAKAAAVALLHTDSGREAVKPEHIADKVREEGKRMGEGEKQHSDHIGDPAGTHASRRVCSGRSRCDIQISSSCPGSRARNRDTNGWLLPPCPFGRRLLKI